MTRDRTMLSRRAGLTAVLALSSMFGSCALGPEIEQPRMFASPYPAPKVWAVAPFANDSGTTIVDGARFADHLARHLQQTKGIDVVPVNRVIETMTALDIGTVTSAQEAKRLIRALDVDGLVVGTITAWNPYIPPKIGAIVQLYARQRRKGVSRTYVDPRRLSSAPTLRSPARRVERIRLVSHVDHYFDASNGRTLRLLRAYAHGRVPPGSPSGYRRYLLSMERYSDFVSFELMRRLFKAEWRRLSKPADEGKGADPPPTAQ